MTNGRRQRVRATDLAEMGFCEQKVRLKAIHGEVDTRSSAAAKNAGKEEHVRFHTQVTQHHNQVRGSGAQDKRCFVATSLYGPADPRTQQLRQFRDASLLPSRAGRSVVQLYYRVSPSIVVTLQRHPWMRPVARRILDFIRHRIVPTHSKEATHEHQPDEPGRA